MMHMLEPRKTTHRHRDERNTWKVPLRVQLLVNAGVSAIRMILTLQKIIWHLDDSSTPWEKTVVGERCSHLESGSSFGDQSVLLSKSVSRCVLCCPKT